MPIKAWSCIFAPLFLKPRPDLVFSSGDDYVVGLLDTQPQVRASASYESNPQPPSDVAGSSHLCVEHVARVLTVAGLTPHSRPTRPDWRLWCCTSRTFPLRTFYLRCLRRAFLVNRSQFLLLLVFNLRRVTAIF
jgi:hypothetical protein